MIKTYQFKVRTKLILGGYKFFGQDKTTAKIGV